MEFGEHRVERIARRNVFSSPASRVKVLETSRQSRASRSGARLPDAGRLEAAARLRSRSPLHVSDSEARLSSAAAVHGPRRWYPEPFKSLDTVEKSPDCGVYRPTHSRSEYASDRGAAVARVSGSTGSSWAAASTPRKCRHHAATREVGAASCAFTNSADRASLG
jgi:hypothetical protein